VTVFRQRPPVFRFLQCCKLSKLNYPSHVTCIFQISAVNLIYQIFKVQTAFSRSRDSVNRFLQCCKLSKLNYPSHVTCILQCQLSQFSKFDLPKFQSFKLHFDGHVINSDRRQLVLTVLQAQKLNYPSQVTCILQVCTNCLHFFKINFPNFFLKVTWRSPNLKTVTWAKKKTFFF